MRTDTASVAACFLFVEKIGAPSMSLLALRNYRQLATANSDRCGPEKWRYSMRYADRMLGN